MSSGRIGLEAAIIGLSIYSAGFLLTMYLIITNFRIGTGNPKQNQQEVIIK
jgi:hypothetical protein